MCKIDVSVSETWKYFTEHTHKLHDELVCIASNPDTGVEVYVTERDGLPEFQVHKGDKILYKEMTLDKLDCEATLRMIFLQYLFTSEVSSAVKIPCDNDSDEETSYDNDDEISRLEAEDLVTEREDVLYSAFTDLLAAAVYDNEDSLCSEDAQQEQDRLFEDILMLIAEHGFPVHRPMLIENPETGLEELIEYPYADIE